jgi:hypothetical protein
MGLAAFYNLQEPKVEVLLGHTCAMWLATYIFHGGVIKLKCEGPHGPNHNNQLHHHGSIYLTHGNLNKYLVICSRNWKVMRARVNKHPRWYLHLFD